jgi:arylsulfatase A-like enzyme
VRQWSAEHETDVALDWLRGVVRSRSGGADGVPFALMLSVNPPHQPFDEVPAEYVGAYAALPPEALLTRRNVDLSGEVGQEAARIAPQYFGAVTAVDAQVGRLLDGLDELGVADETLVIFTSDHGMQLGSHDLLYKNVPYEESVRVPFLARWPGHIPQGRDDLLLGSVDVAPTVLGLLGLGDEVPDEVQGRDCSAALLGRPDAARPDTALYLGPAKYGEQDDVRGLRTGTHKVVASYRQGRLEVCLVDLFADPYELRDVAADEPALTAALLGRLGDELRRTGDPWPGLELLEGAA